MRSSTSTVRRAWARPPFVERLLHKTDDSVVVARCRRDETRRHPREASPKADLELRRYRQAGANAAAVFTFPSGDLAADEFFTTRLMEEYSRVVVVEGDSPLGMADLRPMSCRRLVRAAAGPQAA